MRDGSRRPPSRFNVEEEERGGSSGWGDETGALCVCVCVMIANMNLMLSIGLVCKDMLGGEMRNSDTRGEREREERKKHRNATGGIRD